MPFNINTFKNDALARGGFRPALFEVQVNTLGEEFNWLCMSSQVPSYTTGIIEVPYFGRKIKVAGDRTFDAWTTTVMIEEDFSQRRVLEEWAEKINSAVGNTRSYGSPEDYKEDATVTLYTKQGAPAQTYTLQGCWPSDIGTIELDWNTTDTIGLYSVSWSFDFFEPGQ
jgi:hypothetical protein